MSSGAIIPVDSCLCFSITRTFFMMHIALTTCMTVTILKMSVCALVLKHVCQARHNVVHESTVLSEPQNSFSLLLL